MIEMKQYLIDTFNFNDFANKNILKKIKELPEKEGSIKFFSHLINSQNKWLNRIVKYPNESKLDWWDPLYTLDSIETEWNKSLRAWIDFLEKYNDDELFSETKFIGFDGGIWASEIKDIALQLNYHSIHHRAQIQTLIRQQGIEPDFIDYIGTKYKKISKNGK